MIAAEDGGNGRSCHMRGKNADHLLVKLPVGTCVTDTNGNFLIDLEKHEQKFYAAHGGAGGKGNYYFLSNMNKAPTQFEYGNKGEEVELKLELKMLSDAALVIIENRDLGFITF